MTAHYQEIMELWKTGNFLNAIRFFCRWMPEGLVTEEESENFKKELAKFWEWVEAECEENAEFLSTLYETLKEARNWDDPRLCKELEISAKAIEDIRNRSKPTCEGVGLKTLYQLFPQMAV